MERAADGGLDVHPGQDVEYIVVDDEKSGRDRVDLVHESPATDDVEFYRGLLIRATDSILSPLEFRENAIRCYLADRVDGSIRSYS